MSTVDWFSPTARPTIAAASTNAHHSRRFHNRKLPSAVQDNAKGWLFQGQRVQLLVRDDRVRHRC